MRWACVAAMVVLAGCSDAGAGQGDLLDGEPIEFGQAKVSDATGGITGVVVDATIQPVAGVQVLLDAERATTTDGRGLFVFDEVEPGLRIISANASGYVATQTTTEVVAGQVSKVKIVIGIDARPQPYHNTVRFEWYDSAGVTLVDFVIDLTDETFLGDSVPPLCDECQFFFEADGPVETFVVEASWVDNVGDPTGPTSYYWTLADGEAWTNGYHDGYFRSGEPARVEENAFGDVTFLQVKMSADESWITYDQSAELFVTMFYLAPAPEGWSLIGGDS